MKYIISLLFLTTLLYTKAQVVVALHTSTGVQMFSTTNPFTDAYAAASDGDTIYLPGGQFNVPTTFDKRVVIYGAGIHTDSTLATTKTVFTASITFSDGSDSSHLEGVWINGSITIPSNVNVDNLLIKRNYFTNFLANGSNTTNRSNNIRLEQNFMTDVQLEHVSNVKVYNNVLRRLYYVENGWIANNIFFWNGGVLFSSVNYSLIENNYINSTAGIGSVYSTFTNNIFSTNPTADAWNTYNGNFVSLVESAIFINHQPATSFETANYHLLAPATYVGTTGDEIGLYGGYSPIKEGAVPVNPHIRSVNIAPSTNPAGELNISIEVGAQDQ